MTANWLAEDVSMTFPENTQQGWGCARDYGGDKSISNSRLEEESSCPLRRHQSPNTHYDSKSHPPDPFSCGDLASCPDSLWLQRFFIPRS